MQFNMSFLVFLLVAVALLSLYLWTRRPKNFPPGPWSFPLVGSLPAIKLSKEIKMHNVMWSLARRHGPVMGIFMALRPVVVISGYQAVKTALTREEFSYRPDMVQVNHHFFNRRVGVFFTDGPVWKEQRRFTLRHLREFGFGRHTMEALIHEETRVLLEAVEAEVNAAPDQLKTGVDLLHIFPVLAVNILWTIMAGKRYELSDERFQRLTSAVMAFFRDGNRLSLVSLYPWLQVVPGFNTKFKRQIKAVRQIQDFVEETIEEHIKSYDESSMRDFIDVYIQEMNSQSDPRSNFNKDQLTAVCMDLFSAGTETTASTLGYCLRYMVQRPDVQDKLRAEVLRVVGAERLPAMSDVTKLHYAQAVLHEVLRHSGLSPFTPPHSTVKDTEIMGYQIPKRTMMMINLWTVHMDPEIWGDPEEFRPERFIAKDGTFHKDEHLMLFGYGPRICLGEPLARYSTFLFFTSLVQRFQFHVPSLGPPPSNEQMQGFTTSPAPFRMAITRVK